MSWEKTTTTTTTTTKTKTVLPLCSWGDGGSSYAEIGTDVRPEWPPFSGLEIYLSVYFFIVKYMNSGRHVWLTKFLLPNFTQSYSLKISKFKIGSSCPLIPPPPPPSRCAVSESSNIYAQPFNRTRDMVLCLTLPLVGHTVYVNTEILLFASEIIQCCRTAPVELGLARKLRIRWAIIWREEKNKI